MNAVRTPRDQPLVTVETNLGGDLLLTAVRQALAHLPVRVESVVSTLAILRSTVSEQAIVSAVVPAAEAVAKALAPEAEALLKSAETRLIAEGDRLKAEIDASHNGVLVWLRGALGDVAPAATVDPTSAVPAPPQ